MALALTAATFPSEVEQFDGIVVVDFWAEWCGPCKILSPLIDQLAVEFADDTQVKIAKVNVEEDGNEVLSERYSVMSIPNVKALYKGEVVGEVVGVRHPETYLQLISAAKAHIQPAA